MKVTQITPLLYNLYDFVQGVKMSKRTKYSGLAPNLYATDITYYIKYMY